MLHSFLRCKPHSSCCSYWAWVFIGCEELLCSVFCRKQLHTSQAYTIRSHIFKQLQPDQGVDKLPTTQSVWYRLEHIRRPQVQALYSDTDTHSLSSSISSPFRIGSVFWHLSSTAHLHSSVQTRWYRLQEHLREHLLVVSTLVDPQLHRMSWRTAPGAGVSFVSIDHSLTYCIWHLSVTESGTTEFTIRSWDQTLHWTCARRMCSNQTIRVVGSLSTPWSGFSCLKRCHPTVFAWDVWSCSGQKTEHKNSSDPLNTWTDGYVPSPSSVTAAYDCVLLCLWLLLLSLCQVLALSREPGTGHQCSVSTYGPYYLSLQLIPHVKSW